MGRRKQAQDDESQVENDSANGEVNEDADEEQRKKKARRARDRANATKELEKADALTIAMAELQGKQRREVIFCDRMYETFTQKLPFFPLSTVAVGFDLYSHDFEY